MTCEREVSKSLRCSRRKTMRLVTELENLRLVEVRRVAGRMSRQEKVPIRITGFNGVVGNRRLRDGIPSDAESRGLLKSLGGQMQTRTDLKDTGAFSWPPEV